MPKSVAHEIETLGRRAIAIKADVQARKTKSMRCLQKAIDHFGTLHVVVSTPGFSATRRMTR